MEASKAAIEVAEKLESTMWGDNSSLDETLSVVAMAFRKFAKALEKEETDG